MNNVVTNIRTLKAMEKLGLITLHQQTGTKVNGRTIHYIWEAKNRCFEYKGFKYKETYFDGCFMPFIVCEGKV